MAKRKLELIDTADSKREYERVSSEALTLSFIKHFGLGIAKSEYKPTGYNVWFVTYRRDGRYIVVEDPDLNKAVDSCVWKI